jgi:hypothetical protein
MQAAAADVYLEYGCFPIHSTQQLKLQRRGTVHFNKLKFTYVIKRNGSDHFNDIQKLHHNTSALV